MSNDFIYTSEAGRQTELAKALDGIEGKSQVRTFSGEWGTLAVSGSHYGGFQTLETLSELLIVVGGPVLAFGGNSHLANTDSDGGTRSIHSRIHSGAMSWSDDLAGPFAILRIDKCLQRIDVITDIMSFIPVYHLNQHGVSVIGTHTDAVAGAIASHVEVDVTSLIDLVLHGVVTYPYTNYINMRQFPPASAVTLQRGSKGLAKANTRQYWLPRESREYHSIESAAREIEESLEWYVSAVTDNVSRVAHLLSGGEDSRVIGASIPKAVERKAFIAADSYNREAKIAKRVADALGAESCFMERPRMHYIENMPRMARLVGRNFQSIHAHWYGFSGEFGLDKYPAVFGGYFADSILKAEGARRSLLKTRLRFLPDRIVDGETRTRPVESSLFPSSQLREVTRRRIDHYERIAVLRPDSAHEWFSLWPATMRVGSPNIASSRRIMASFEPFTSSGIVKVGAAVPANWKADRRLFRLGTKRFLRQTKRIPHGDGRYPYYAPAVNHVVQIPTWVVLAVKRLSAAVGFKRTYEGPWSDWYGLAKSGALATAAQPYEHVFRECLYYVRASSLKDLMLEDSLAIEQRATVLGLCVWFSEMEDSRVLTEE